MLLSIYCLSDDVKRNGGRGMGEHVAPMGDRVRVRHRLEGLGLGQMDA